MKTLTILPAKGCRRSRRILEYLQTNHIPYERVELDSPEGEKLMAKYHFLASPGILIDGERINPYDVLIQPACKVNEEKFKQLLTVNGDNFNE